MEGLNISLGKNSYNIIFAEDYIEKLKEYLSTSGPNIIITDSNVYRVYKEVYEAELASYNFHTFVIPEGEASKSINTTIDILNYMLDNGFMRSSRIIAFGGGVVGDIAGFVASIYMRGIDLYQVPTTLLAQVDSSVGGKTAINFPQGKNMVGSFYQPKEVLIAPVLLKTLDKQQLTSGIGEIIKYGLIFDYSFMLFIKESLQDIYQINTTLLKEIIRRCCEIKASIVEQDEKDEGIRKILNLGHTFGHAIEALSNYQGITHGEAVLTGILYESILAEGLGLIDKEYFDEISEIISKTNTSTDLSRFSMDNLMKAMSMDKKNHLDKISFILPVARGKVKEVLLTKDEVYATLGKQGVIR